MSYNRTIGILLLSLLVLVHCQSVAAWLIFENSREKVSILGDSDDESGSLNDLEEIMTVAPEDFSDYASANNVYENHKDSLLLVSPSINDPEDTLKDSGDILSSSRETEDSINDAEDLEGTQSSSQQVEGTEENPGNLEDTRRPEELDEYYSSSQKAEYALKDKGDLEGTQRPSQDAEDAVKYPEDLEETFSSSHEAEVPLNDPKDPENTRRPSQEDPDDFVVTTELQEAPEDRSHAFGLFLRQLGPLIFQAFFSSVITVIFNWFYPFKVVPPPPGLVGVSQLWGGLPHPKHWHHHWGHLHLGPGKWGDGNWGHAYWGPAYSGHTPLAPPTRLWEPHPHAHL